MFEKLFSRSSATPNTRGTVGEHLGDRADVFISYKSDERGIAGMLAASLEKYGFNVWWDGKLKPGDDYQRTIRERLHAAKAAVVIWSEKSAQSEWVRAEAEEARSKSTLIPVRIDDVRIWPPFNVMHTLDMTGWFGDITNSAFIELVGTLREKVFSGASALPPSQFRKSPGDQVISQSSHLIHKLKAKDSTGRWAYYFILVQPHQEKGFMQAIGGSGTIDLEDHGVVVGSCYGEKPSEDLKQYLKNIYGFNVES